MTDEQHPDPATEAAQTIAHSLMPAAAVAEVGARLLAARRRRRADQDERATAELRRQLAADHAEAVAAYGRALDPDWLTGCTLQDLGAAWQAAQRNAPVDPQAADAVNRIEDRLRDLHPAGMGRYDTLRAEGLTPHAAMAEAAHVMATVHPHPQGTTTRPGLGGNFTEDIAAAHAAAASYTPGLNPHWIRHAHMSDLAAVWHAAHDHAADDTRAATAAHQVEEQLRRMHPPAMRLYDDLRAAGHGPADAMRQAAVLFAFVDPSARPGQPAPPRPQLTVIAGSNTDVTRTGPDDDDTLADQAARDRAAGSTAAGTPDDPATTAVDEHAAGLTTGSVLDGTADREATTATALHRQMYPHSVQTELAAADAAPTTPAARPSPLQARSRAVSR